MIDFGIALGALGFLIAILSLGYSHRQSSAAREQVKSARTQALDALQAAELVAQGARMQAVEALRAAGLVATSAREQAVEALRAAELVAKSAREQAVEALRAAQLVAEGATRQALEALRAAELLATAEVSSRVREMRARNFRANPHLPANVKAHITAAGGPDAYSVLLDSLDISQEIYLLRKRGLVTDEHWRMWMHDQMLLIASAPSFEDAFHRAVKRDTLSAEFVTAFTRVFHGERMTDPSPRDSASRAGQPASSLFSPRLAFPSRHVPIADDQILPG